MLVPMFLSLHDTVSLAITGSELVLENVHARLTFNQTSPGIRAALEHLAKANGEFDDQLMNMVMQADGPAGLAKFVYFLNRLIQRGLLLSSARLQKTCLATLEANSPQFFYQSRAISPERSYILSRFAYLRRQAGNTVLESPLSYARIRLNDWRAAALVHALSKPCRLSEMNASIPVQVAECMPVLLTLLLNANMVQVVDEDGTSSEDHHPELQSWEFHDLLFHARSRLGRHDGSAGGTFRFVGRLDAPPAVKPPMSNDTIDLYRPDLERLAREDLPMAVVQEQRHSIRLYDDVPLNAQQLGEFLYRVGRIKNIEHVEIPIPSGQTVPMDFAFRPYPSGGALYELELYIVVNAGADLERGLYHYDPQNHRLERLNKMNEEVNQLLADASQATTIPKERLQILIIIAARVQRIAWKYETIAYATILKNVGVLYQSMYLAATAMGLAPCGIGSGDSDVFARAAGIDYYAETSVGEFLLGSKASSK